MLQYLVEEYHISMAVTFPIQQSDGQRLDPRFTLKSALDSQNKDMFAYVLEIGCSYYKDDVMKQFLELIVNQGYDIAYVKIMFASSFFKRWFCAQNLFNFKFSTLDELFMCLGIEDPSTAMICKNTDQGYQVEPTDAFETGQNKALTVLLEPVNECLSLLNMWKACPYSLMKPRILAHALNHTLPSL